LETEFLICTACGKEFEWIIPRDEPTAERPKYHSKSCKNKSRVRRRDSEGRKAVRYIETLVRCPNPYKKVFVTEKIAQEWIDRVHRGDDGMLPYRCQCGAIHIGHSQR
jgi:hypothetical protein